MPTVRCYLSMRLEQLESVISGEIHQSSPLWFAFHGNYPNFIKNCYIILFKLSKCRLDSELLSSSSSTTDLHLEKMRIQCQTWHCLCMSPPKTVGVCAKKKCNTSRTQLWRISFKNVTSDCRPSPHIVSTMTSETALRCDSHLLHLLKCGLVPNQH